MTSQPNIVLDHGLRAGSPISRLSLKFLSKVRDLLNHFRVGKGLHASLNAQGGLQLDLGDDIYQLRAINVFTVVTKADGTLALAVYKTNCLCSRLIPTNQMFESSSSSGESDNDAGGGIGTEESTDPDTGKTSTGLTMNGNQIGTLQQDADGNYSLAPASHAANFDNPIHIHKVSVHAGDYTAERTDAGFPKVDPDRWYTETVDFVAYRIGRDEVPNPTSLKSDGNGGYYLTIVLIGQGRYKLEMNDYYEGYKLLQDEASPTILSYKVHVDGNLKNPEVMPEYGSAYPDNKTTISFG